MSTDLTNKIRSILERLGLVSPGVELRLELLPSEILLIITKYLDFADIINLCRISELADECELIWEGKYRQLYGKQAPKLYLNLSWERNLLEMGVYGFGENNDGQLGLSDIFDYEYIPQRIPDTQFLSDRIVKIIQVSAGHRHTVCIDENGHVWSFGNNEFGQLGLGLGDTVNRDTPQRIDPNFFSIDGQPVRITQLSAGGVHTVCLDDKGNVWTFGQNRSGQLGLGDTVNRDTPQRIDPNFFSIDGQPVRIIKVSAGILHTVCLDKNDNVWTFGNNNDGQLGLGKEIGETVSKPHQIDPSYFIVDQQPVKIIQVSAGSNHTVCLDKNGNVWGFGGNTYGQLGMGLDFGNVKIVNVPKQIPPKYFNNIRIIQISAGGYHTVCLDENRSVWSFGLNLRGQLGLGHRFEGVYRVHTPHQIDPSFSLVDQQPVKIIQVSTGAEHTGCIDENGNVWGFGNDRHGQLGVLNVRTIHGMKVVTSYIPTPEKIEDIKAVQISTGGYYTMLIGL